MLISTMILGWIGVIIFLILIFTYQMLVKSNEFAFLHLLMAIMYAMWFPLPLVLYDLLNSDVLLVGTLFGLAYLFSLVISMALQTGHIAFITKNNKDYSITDKLGEYMMSTLSNPLESLLGVFKGIWAIFLGIAFWQNDEMLMASIMLIFASFIIYYLFIMLDTSLVKRVKLFSKIKPNPYFVNLETLLFFIILMSYITLYL